MEFQPKNPTAKGPADWFTGDVWIDTIAQAHGPSPTSIGSVVATSANGGGFAKLREIQTAQQFLRGNQNDSNHQRSGP